MARSLGDSIKDEIWRELAAAKYRRWEDESAARCAERSMLKQRLAKALAALQDGELDGCQVSIDDLVGSVSKCRQSTSQCLAQALAAWQVGELNDCQVLLAQTLYQHSCLASLHLCLHEATRLCLCFHEASFFWRSLQALGVLSCTSCTFYFCSRFVPSGPGLCWYAEWPAPEVWERPGGERLAAAKPQTRLKGCVYVSCCVQNGATPEVRERHQSEDAALQRLFDDAARPDTPGEFSNAFACRLTLEVGCCLRAVHSGKSAASRSGHAGQPFSSCLLFVGVPKQAGSAREHTVSNGFHCLHLVLPVIACLFRRSPFGSRPPRPVASATSARRCSTTSKA